MTDDDHLDRINALTRNARNTWFGLLGALVFVGITLMSVEHIDFYGVDRATQLPLVNVEVPTRFFFAAAPLLVAAIYGYFHLYLIRLWDALSVAPTRIQGKKLGDTVTPWLVTDAALHFRRRLRSDDCTTPRTLEGGAMLLNFLLAWGFGLVVLWFTWQLSMPARTFWLTAIAAASFALSIVAGASSLAMLAQRMRRVSDGSSPRLWATSFQTIGLLIGGAAILWNSYERTEGPPGRLAPLAMIDETIVERPPSWLPHSVARQEFRDVWCARQTIRDCQALTASQAFEFQRDWRLRRGAVISDMRRPEWHKAGRQKPDLRNADLSHAFLAGLNLREGQMQGAILRQANAEGADFYSAMMQNTEFNLATLDNANFDGANLENATFGGASMNGAIFAVARLADANMSGANLERAIFRNAFLTRTNLSGSRLEGANLAHALIENANFSGSYMGAVNLSGARIVDSNLSYSFIGNVGQASLLNGPTALFGVRNDGGAMRSIDLSETRFDNRTDFRNTFFDASLVIPAAIIARMGDLCQTVSDRVLDETEFFGRWRGWLEVRGPISWHLYAPPGFESVSPIPPDDPNCDWKTGPMPGATE
ncbi:MAG: pentapeptide repeat-containing protein [Pseudomonadota bacterium]